MDHDTEFKQNTDFDRYALYLRPLDSDGQPLYVPEASEAQKRWGGLHVTLCGFAPKKGSGAPQTHPFSLVEALSKTFRMDFIKSGFAPLEPVVFSKACNNVYIKVC